MKLKRLVLLAIVLAGACTAMTAPRHDECRSGYNIFTGRDSTSSPACP